MSKKNNSDQRQINNNLEENRSRNIPDNGASTRQNNTVKDPDDWKTGDEPITGAQRSYLNTLASEAGEEVEDDLTKRDAAKKIEELQQKTGRGGNQQNNPHH
jgi:hypothetical protein